MSRFSGLGYAEKAADAALAATRFRHPRAACFKAREKPSPANRFHTLGFACQALFGGESMRATTHRRNRTTGNDCA